MTQTLNGTPGNDTITGTNPGDASNPDGIDFINGLDGNDTLSGLGGGDTIDGGAGLDTVDYSASASRVDINLLGHQAANGDAQGDTLTNIENVTGSAFNDFIGGDDGANVLRGGNGDDGLGGGLGADVLDGGAGIDWVYYDQSAAVQIDLSAGTGHGGQAEGDTLSGIEGIRGSTHDDQLTGDAGDNVFEGYFGADALNGGAGSDTAAYFNSDAGVQVDLAAHTATGGHAQGDTLTNIENLFGSAFADQLTGDAGANALTGNNGDDILVGGAGGDTLDGSAGVDTVAYNNSAAGVWIDLMFNTVKDGDAQGDTLTGIENLTGSAFADVLVGDAGANVLNGLDGNDWLGGFAGADTINGGAGIDTLSFIDSAAGVQVDLAAGIGHGGDAEGDTYSAVENVAASAFNDTLTGDAGANVLTGNNGDDILAGGAGGDTLDGGAGADTAAYNNSAAGVWIDLMFNTVKDGDAQGDTLTGIENLTGSAFADVLVGDAGANVLNGLDGNDWLGGFAGADTINGGAGIDTLSFTDSTAGVQIDLAAGIGHGGDAEGDTYIATENVEASAFNDTLIGDAGANVLSGNNGYDTLRGGAGADTLNGGAGIDAASYATSVAGVTIDLVAGTGMGGDAQGDTLTGIENVIGSSLQDTLTGDAGANILWGLGGDDSLNGGDGADRLVGAGGVDTIHGGTGNDTVDAGIGNDQVFGEAGHDNVYGGAGNDQIDGGDGNDILEGDGGADTIIGGAGIDTASYASSAAAVSVNLATGAMSGGDAAGDTLSGIEQVVGSAFADTLTGDANANTLWGMAGNDVLIGGGGGDALKGGAGNDRFVYTALSDSAVSGIGKDGIMDFSAGDKIDLSAIDADGNSANGDTAFTFGTGDFTRHAGELRVVAAGAIQVVYVDVNGDKAPDFAINVTSDHTLTASDFVL